MRTGTLGIVVGLLLTSTVSAQHFTDIWVGQTPDGELSIGGFPLDRPLVLAPVDGVVTGWSSGNPGFDNIRRDGQELLPLAEGSEIWLDLEGLAPGCGCIDNDQYLHTHEDIVASSTGVDSIYVGDENLHVHFTWLIDSSAEDFDPMQTLWTADLRLRDASGNQATSQTFTIMFSNVHCALPGDINDDQDVTDVDLDIFYGILDDPTGATHEQRCAADLNLDGFATAADETIFLAEVGLEETPIRGDADGSLLVDMTDALMVLQHLFLGDEKPVSVVHGNANGDFAVDMTDSIYLLSFLFLGGDQPPAPFNIES